MPQQRDRSGAGSTITRGLRSTVGRESTTFGFSILATVMFGALQVVHGPPDLPRIFLYAAGAVMSFTLLEGVLSGGFRKPMPQHHTRTLAMGTSLNIVSVLVGLGTALLLGQMVSHVVVWALAPLAGGAAYLVTESIETAVAERILVRLGDLDADDVSG